VAGESDDNVPPVDLSQLPPGLAELIPNLDRGQLVALQAYLEVHNHMGDYPLHLTVEALDELVPGFAKESLDESLNDARDERKRINQAQVSEIAGKYLALTAGWGLAIFGAIRGIEILSKPEPEVFAGGLVLFFCIGGPAAVAWLARNSSIRFGVQTKFEDE